MTQTSLNPLRYSIADLTRLLALSRSTLYDRIKHGLLKVSKDGGRTFVTAAELQRYLNSTESSTQQNSVTPEISSPSDASPSKQEITRPLRTRGSRRSA